MSEDKSLGRRELSKQAKLERITAVAKSLFAEKSIAEVTTNEVAKLAEIASGTLFLYAKTKGELLLLAQNDSYRQAHAAGAKAAARETEPVAAILATMKPIIECNREHVENGRTYLQEVVFGAPTEGYRQEALELMAGTERAVAEIAARNAGTTDQDGALRAKAAMAIMFLTLSSPLNVALTIEELMAEIESQLRFIL